MNVIDVIEGVFSNDTVTEDFAVRIANGDIPMNQIGELLSKLFSYYGSWRDNEEQIRAGETREIFFPLDPYPPDTVFDGRLNKLKGLILYFPTISIADPIAEVIWPVWIMGGFPETSEPQVRMDLARALKLLASLRPFIEEGQISLLPSAFALGDREIQDAVRVQVDALGKHNSLYAEMDDRLVEQVKLLCTLSSLCEYTPVAGRAAVSQVLSAEYETAYQRLKQAAALDYRVARNLWQYQLPGLERANIMDVAKFRHEAPFLEWRNALAGIFEQVDKARSTDEDQFRREFQRAAEYELTPKLAAMNSKIEATEYFSDILVPGALLLGGGSITS
jgi:hypothetical protein